MKILYISTLCAKSTIDDIDNRFKTCLNGVTVQKFHRLIVQGLVANGASIDTCSSIPINGTKSNFINIPDITEDNINFHYLKVINIPILRHIWLIFGTFFYAYKWSLRYRTKKKVIICDSLNISICIGALFCKFLGQKVVGIMTDMPGLMVGGVNKGILGKIIAFVNFFVLSKFSAYVFLTEAMNERINSKHHEYIVMEGLVDIKMKDYIDSKSKRHNFGVRNILYAGGLHERYGIKLLIDAFRDLKGDDLRLIIYGHGTMAKEMQYYQKLDSRIEFYGLRPNEEVVEKEMESTLLVNPRPTHEEFTKYSFPSKNMEYMVSGTPLLTTRLPGMPKDYYDYVYLFEEETVEGYTRLLSIILSKDYEELSRKGLEAQKWILGHKNNIIQTSRIIELINKI